MYNMSSLSIKTKSTAGVRECAGSDKSFSVLNLIPSYLKNIYLS